MEVKAVQSFVAVCDEWGCGPAVVFFVRPTMGLGADIFTDSHQPDSDDENAVMDDYIWRERELKHKATRFIYEETHLAVDARPKPSRNTDQYRTEMTETRSYLQKVLQSDP